jgi:hypothetical protein
MEDALNRIAAQLEERNKLLVRQNIYRGARNDLLERIATALETMVPEERTNHADRI